MKIEEMKNLAVDALKKEIHERKRELFTLKIGASTSPVKDSSQFRKLRVRIAQLCTVLRQKESKN